MPDWFGVRNVAPAIVVALAAMSGGSAADAQTISFVQSNYAVPQTPQSTVTVTFPSAQNAGDLNVVAIGWNDVVSHVVSVTDSRGNTYALAVGPTVQAGIQTQAVYFAANITAAPANTNTVTVTFDHAADFPDVRIAEYSGLATVNPVDAAHGASGSGSVSDSGAVVTTNAGDLLVAANYVQALTIQGDAGFTVRMVTTPDGNILEDRVVTAAGSYNATASLNGNRGWVMQIVAFRRASGTSDSQPPSVPANPGATAVSSGQIDLRWTVSIDNVGVTGYLIERCQGTGCTAFTPIATSAATSYVDSGLSASTSYSYRLRAADAAGNLSGYSTTATATTPAATTAVTFVQSNYAVPQTPQATVTVGYSRAQTAGNLNVVVIGWNDVLSHVVSIADSRGNSYALAAGPTVQPGTQTQAIYFAANIAAAAANANSVIVTFDRPADFPDVRIAEYSGLATVNPVDAAHGASGSGSMSDSGTVVASAGDLLVAANYVQGLTIQGDAGFTTRLVTTPDGNILEDRVVTAAGSYNATASLTGNMGWVMQIVAFRGAGAMPSPPTITGLNPASAAIGTAIVISGANFGVSQGTSTVTFNGTPASPTSWSATSIVAPVPVGATTGNLVVTVGGRASNAVSFTVTTSSSRPTITAINPASGPVGALVTITGANFGSTRGTSAVTFNGTAASPTSWSAASIVTPVPSGATTGNVVVTVSGQPSNGVSFTVTSTTPVITGVNPTSGVVGTLVTITGANFGAVPGGSSVSFNGTIASPSSWSATSIVAAVPSGATSGPVVVTVGGASSNGVSFAVAAHTSVAYPLKTSANGRYLVDQNNVPFLLVGDTAHGLTGKASEEEAEAYFAEREARRFNSVVIYAPCGGHVTCNNDASTFDGIRPFTSGDSPDTYDLSTPNETYFSRVDRLVTAAGRHGLNVFLDPIETGSFLETLRNNGPAKAFAYGVYVGTRYRDFPNIVWNLGEDFQTWETDAYLVAPVMAGIAAADSNHLQTIQLSFPRSFSNEARALLGPHAALDLVYTYFETYEAMLAAYNSSPTIPAFLGEANYEDENNTTELPGPTGPKVIRQQIYWALLSGAAGHFFGNGPVNHTLPDWVDHLDTPAVAQVPYSTDLFTSYHWWNLVPDQTHQVVIAGYGTFEQWNANLTTSTYVTAAWIEDGSLALAYSPTSATLTVDLTRFARPIVAKWYDPTSGRFLSVPGSPFNNSGTHQFVTPGMNGDGDADWVLVLDATTATFDTEPPTVPSALTATAGPTGIVLDWIASTDNVGVSGYLIERCQGAACGSFAQVAISRTIRHSDSGLLPSTSFRYRVRAMDAAGNLSSYSNLAAAVTSTITVPITFRQVNYATPQTPQLSVTVPFMAAQTAGDLNVVVVGWSDSTAQVQSVTDSLNNIYVRAVGPTVQPGVATQSIYYAANVAAAPANANSITVTFTTAARYADVRIAEYGGIALTDPVEAVVAAEGTGNTSSSGPLSVASANSLLVAANTVQTITTAPGNAFTNRVITSPDGDILEDRVVTAAGVYTATAAVSPTADWIMQMVAFRAASP